MHLCSCHRSSSRFPANTPAVWSVSPLVHIWFPHRLFRRSRFQSQIRVTLNRVSVDFIKNVAASVCFFFNRKPKSDVVTACHSCLHGRTLLCLLEHQCVTITRSSSGGDSVCLSLPAAAPTDGSVLSPGPPGPPGVVIVEEISDATATLSWTRGLDNHSPIIAYNLQARSPFSLGWQTVKTGNQ